MRNLNNTFFVIISYFFTNVKIDFAKMKTEVKSCKT